MRRRFVGGALVVLAGVVGVGVALGALATRLLGGDGSAPAVGIAVLVVALAVLGRTTVRWARPVHGVMAAADRVADGDLSARAPTAAHGPHAVRRLATSFNEMATRLEDDDERRRQLLADVAHELRTPLTIVRGTLEGIVDGVYAPDERRLRRVLDEVDRLERLLADLRTLSTADAGVLSLHVDEVALTVLVHRVVELQHPRAAAAGVRLTTDLPPALPPVAGDRGRLEQVVHNLVDNALRHARGATVVHVACHTGDDHVVLRVTDDGAGIPADVLPHVFDRFTGSADVDGTGLGLPIVQRLVERHGGDVAVTSDPGGGTTITVRLPLLRA